MCFVNFDYNSFDDDITNFVSLVVFLDNASIRI